MPASNPKITLASQSEIRRTILSQCGFDVTTKKSGFDERALEAEMDGAAPEILAEALAVGKACTVSENNLGAIVVGADQVLALDDTLLHKATTKDAARVKLSALQGKTHRLISSAAIANNGERVWSGTTVAHMTMRQLSEQEIEAYLNAVGDVAFSSVGAYRIEELGASLFERVDGDNFTVMGLPLFKLLSALRDIGLNPLIQTSGKEL